MRYRNGFDDNATSSGLELPEAPEPRRRSLSRGAEKEMLEMMEMLEQFERGNGCSDVGSLLPQGGLLGMDQDRVLEAADRSRH
jgi:hypothetical protein